MKTGRASSRLSLDSHKRDLYVRRVSESPSPLKFPCLDHGYVKFVEAWGSDERIIEAARNSTNKGFLGWGPVVVHDEECPHFLGRGIVDDRGFPLRQGVPYFDTKTCPTCGGDGCKRVAGDEKLLRYLYEHKHSAPFEFAGLTIEVQAPIFIFRQWHRHRTQSYNEMSARYTPLPVLDYVPTVERCIVVEGKNKQAGKAVARTPTHEEVIEWLEKYVQEAYEATQRAYDRGLEIGIPKEVARIPGTTVGRYSRMYATANLRNWLAFLTLRNDAHAQEEIQVFARSVARLVEEKFPRTYALFCEGRERDVWTAANLSRIDRLRKNET